MSLLSGGWGSGGGWSFKAEIQKSEIICAQTIDRSESCTSNPSFKDFSFRTLTPPPVLLKVFSF